MEIRLNGEEMRFPAGITLVDLIDHLGLAGRRVAIECNRAIIPRDRHGEHRLASGDIVEVVQFVGGG
ncbi:MAG: sulfur carrier protein ThiS [bacterium]